MVNSRNALNFGLPAAADALPVEWRVSESLIDYADAVAAMAARAAAIADGTTPEQVWLLEHPPLYTAGTGAQADEIVDPRFPLFQTGRGGQTTYHGPGQRIAYVMLDLRRRGPDVRRYVATLEEWIIRSLAAFGIRGERRDDRIGVWVRRPERGEGREDKIAALGIRVQRWVTLHGIAINVAPELSHFSGIVPCGVRDARYGVTSLADLGLTSTLGELDLVLRREFEPLFGPTADYSVGRQENASPGRREASSASLPASS